MINILLAEDHNIVRDGIRSLLEKEDYLHINGEAVNGAEALLLLQNGIQADIVIADMNMPIMGGMELAEHIKKQYPEIKVIILSALDHEKYILKAFQSGVKGYLLKNITSDELIFAIKQVYNNSEYVCSELTSRFINRLLAIPEPVISEHLEGIKFSSKEIEILGFIAEGFTNQEIADKLFTSRRTIEGHRQSLIEKTGARNSIALVRFAILHGVIN